MKSSCIKDRVGSPWPQSSNAQTACDSRYNSVSVKKYNIVIDWEGTSIRVLTVHEGDSVK